MSVQDTFDARKSIYSESMLHVDIVLKELVIDDLVGLKGMFLGSSPSFSAVDGTDRMEPYDKDVQHSLCSCKQMTQYSQC